MGERLTPRMKIGDVLVIGGMRLVCVPDYLLTHVGVDPNTAGILLPADAADALLSAMRTAGIIPAEPAPETPANPEATAALPPGDLLRYSDQAASGASLPEGQPQKPQEPEQP